MKQLFEIKQHTDADVQKVLSIRLGARHCCFSIANKQGDTIYQLAYVTTEDWSPSEWEQLFEMYPELNGLFYEVLVAYDFPESSLIPLKNAEKADPKNVLKTLYGVTSQSSVISEAVNRWQLHNIYAVPAELKLFIENKFPAARYWHQYSLDIRDPVLYAGSGTLLVDFRKEEFVVIATRNNTMLLTQTYPYATPEDILYYLVRICNQFSLSRETVQLQLSGLIDQESALYKELYQYFLHTGFREASWNTGPDYPSHFFTLLNDLTQCVS